MSCPEDMIYAKQVLFADESFVDKLTFFAIFFIIVISVAYYFYLRNLIKNDD